MSSKKKGIIRSLFTPKVRCGCSNPKLADIINPGPKPKQKDSAQSHPMMHLNPLSSSSVSWERTASTSRDQDDDDAELDHTSTTFSLTSVASSSEYSGSHHPNTPRKAAKAVLGDSIAVEKHSFDPYNDFQQSILQMIVQKRIYSKSDLQELLNSFLQLNSPFHHHTIIKAFTDLLSNSTAASANRLNNDVQCKQTFTRK
ncbi:unnamed protein product [Rhodiola kirilowii]